MIFLTHGACYMIESVKGANLAVGKENAYGGCRHIADVRPRTPGPRVEPQF